MGPILLSRHKSRSELGVRWRGDAPAATGHRAEPTHQRPAAGHPAGRRPHRARPPEPGCPERSRRRLSGATPIPTAAHRLRRHGLGLLEPPRVRAAGPRRGRGRDILELGCGAAQWSIALARAGARPVGLDLSEGGLFAFCHLSPIVDVCWPDAADRAGDRLVRDHFGMHRIDDDEVLFQLPYGEWTRLFRAHGFQILDLLEPRPPTGRGQLPPRRCGTGLVAALASGVHLAAGSSLIGRRRATAVRRRLERKRPQASGQLRGPRRGWRRSGASGI